jgi:hypothetical protein
VAAKYEKVMVCLANSRKLSGRCVAGKEYDPKKLGRWIRPVSARISAEVSEEERRFENGQDPKLLDIIRVPMIEPKPHGFQGEHPVIDDQSHWVNEGRASLADLRRALDKETGPLWDNSSSSSYNGTHDRVAEAIAAKQSSSLKLIEVSDFKIEVAVEGTQFGKGKRKVRGLFSLDGTQYKLAVTDPLIERQYLAKVDGIHNVASAILCISLGEPYNGFAYKLIAGVIIG